LSWDQYKRLITVKDPAERKRIEATAVRKDWNTAQLEEYLNVKRAMVAVDDKPPARLAFTRGRLNTFKLTELGGPWGARLWLDLGFRVRHELKPREAGRFKPGDCVEVRGARYELADAPDKELFTYRARAGKIIDGDTLYATIDLNFGVVIEQKLRLRGIDCPEIGTPEGKRAKSFVVNSLKGCDWIIVKTFKDSTDKYDRYLADIFYTPGESDPGKIAGEGRFLNQELLDGRLAVLYS
jgi:endonuclease YncB( thermonuclease family)